MPVSLENSRVVYEALMASGVRMMSALPETWLVHLIRMAEDDPGMTLVRLAKEEEGVGISAGAHLAGMRSALLMQNHGFFQSVNGIVSLALLYKIPLLMLISDRGRLRRGDDHGRGGGRAVLARAPCQFLLPRARDGTGILDGARHRAGATGPAGGGHRRGRLGVDESWRPHDPGPLRSAKPHAPCVRQREPAVRGRISYRYLHGVRPGRHRPRRRHRERLPGDEP
ncbi:MAG: hypothetical protein HYX51_05325 [Chloroflexi bacterium]|nr:hypothetical protein [Chloroflexota bacterium]